MRPSDLSKFFTKFPLIFDHTFAFWPKSNRRISRLSIPFRQTRMALSQRNPPTQPSNSGGIPSGLTFAEAYLLQKAKEAEIKTRKGETRSLVSNIEELQYVLQRIKQNLETEVPLKQIKTTLRAIPPHFSKHITEWHDEDKLNLLHHAILHDKPTVVNYLLAETNFFPARHAPALNPYAHLAAITGHAECLRSILQHRPNSFFASDKPEHAIRLPDYIMRKLRAKEKTGTVRTKTAHKLLERIKMTTQMAEKKIKQEHSTDASDITALLDKDMGNVDRSFQMRPVKLHVMPMKREREPRKSFMGTSKRERPTLLISNMDQLKRDFSKEGAKRSMRLSVPHVSPRLSLVKPPNSLNALKSMPSKSKNLPALDQNHFIRRLKPNCGGHLITVFWDVVSRFDQGVVNRAGDPIQVQHAPNSHMRPGQSEISLSSSHSIMNWPSPYRKKSRSKDMLNKKLSSHGSKSQLKPTKSRPPKFIEPGVRGAKAFKEFHLKLPSHDQREKEEHEHYMGKTPLSYAAEKGFEDCAQTILDMVVVKRNPTISPADPLTLAAKARSPETIILLIDKHYSRDDFQSAVLLSIREMLPDCLTALLSKGRSRNILFEGVNLYHVLYSQCVISGTRFELMPEMTHALISCKEDVNAHNIPMTYPMYTLINCAFNITIGHQIFFFIECLHILLENKANPHFDEEKQSKLYMRGSQPFSRKAFTSAINCIFDSAKNAVNFFEKSYWSKLFMKKFVTTIELFDRTHRRVLNTVLFEYMDAICELGLDRTIVKCLLRYGANPDYMQDGKYPVNVYFDKILPYMTKFEIINSYDHYRQELDTLMIICKSMTPRHLSNASQIFLQVWPLVYNYVSRVYI